MKKLTSLLCFAALGLFAVGCEETTTVDEVVPTPEVTPDTEGGSLDGDATITEEDELSPPVIEEEPPALTTEPVEPEMPEPVTPPAPAEPVEPTTETPPAPTDPAAETEEPAAEGEAEATPEATPETPAPEEEPTPAPAEGE